MTHDLHSEENYPVDDPTTYIDGFEVINHEDDFDAIELFSYAATQDCSDIHMIPGAPVKLRVKGDLVPVEGTRLLNSKDIDSLRQQTMSDTDLGQFVKKVTSHSYAYDLPGVGRFRIIAARASAGITLTARKLVDIAPTFDDLGTNEVIRDLANLHSGLVLVSGITGSGKSTLMAAIVNAINFDRADNIISIEDPVEIVHRSFRSNIIQRSLGTDVFTFSEGVVDAMRQDPDVILIGEIRDAATARACLEAAESGHLVISTVHAMTSITSIGRILDLFPAGEVKAIRNKFADVLRAIVSQKLVRSTDASGSRIAVNEVLLNTNEMKELIESEAAPSQFRKLLEASEQYGMQTFEQDFLALVKTKRVAKSVAQAQAANQQQMKEMLASLETLSPTKNTVIPNKKTPLIPSKPAKPFSEVVEEEDKEKGIVVHPSGAAPSLPKAPVRPTFYVPPVR